MSAYKRDERQKENFFTEKLFYRESFLPRGKYMCQSRVEKRDKYFSPLAINNNNIALYTVCALLMYGESNSKSKAIKKKNES